MTSPPPRDDTAAGLAEAHRRFGTIQPTDTGEPPAHDADVVIGSAEAVRRFGDRAGPAPDTTGPLHAALRKERQLRRAAERLTRSAPVPTHDDGTAGLNEARRRFGDATPTPSTTNTQETR